MNYNRESLAKERILCNIIPREYPLQLPDGNKTLLNWSFRRDINPLQLLQFTRYSDTWGDDLAFSRSLEASSDMPYKYIAWKRLFDRKNK